MRTSTRLKRLEEVRFRIFIIIFFVHFSFCFSQGEDASPITSGTVEIDSAIATNKEMVPADSVLQNNYTTQSEVFPKSFKPKFRNSYKSEEFNYTTIKPHESLWQRIERKIVKILESIFGKLDPRKASQYTSLILRILGIVIVGFLLYFIIRYLLSKDGNFFLSKKNKKINIPEGDIHENIHEINFPETIAKFEKSKDFRFATRYRFLQLLKNLSDRKIINWNIEKTNRDYIKELKSESQKQNFRELAYIFDYVWYGEFKVDEDEYQRFKSKFENSKF